jgi:hypothetical protein
VYTVSANFPRKNENACQTTAAAPSRVTLEATYIHREGQVITGNYFHADLVLTHVQILPSGLVDIGGNKGKTNDL